MNPIRLIVPIAPIGLISPISLIGLITLIGAAFYVDSVVKFSKMIFR